MAPLALAPTGTGFSRCHLTPEPRPPCAFSQPSKHLTLQSLDLGGGSGWRPAGRSLPQLHKQSRKGHPHGEGSSAQRELRNTYALDDVLVGSWSL